MTRTNPCIVPHASSDSHGASRRTTGASHRALLAVVAAGAFAASACTPTVDEVAQRKGLDPNDTMTMSEMRLQDAGGPAPAARPTGLVEPVASPAAAGAPSPRALTDAGANTPLGKEWIFTSVTGFAGSMPGPPKVASFVMSRESGRLVGSTSCNPLTAAFTVDVSAGTMRFRNVVNGTAMCSRESGDVEDAVVGALVATDGFRLYQDRMLLLSKGATIAELRTP
jgi:heat shock protein HslJ